uniref:FIIND domain-containing protein n=2 Tax=Pygocentrus nattereri TaxID=42514 RepID=A0AAR2KW96_PYGNA
MQCQIWRVALQESSTDFDNLLRLFGFEMHLSVQEQQNSKMFQNTKDVLTAKRQNKVKLYLHLDTQQFAAKSLLENIYGSLHNIADLRVISTGRSSEVLSFQMDLFLQGALYEMETGQTCVPQLLSLNSHFSLHSPSEQSNFICTLYLRAKQMGVLAVLQPVFQAWPSYWVVDLAERKTSLFFLVELLKFHTKISKMKKPVEIWGSAEEHELRIFLQCLPYVSQVRFSDYIHNKADDTKAAIKVLVDLFICASEIDKDNYLKMLSSVCSYSSFPFADDTGENQSTFLLELYSYVIEYESRTGRSVLSALLPIYQSAPTVWVIDLSKSVTSLLYQTMQLQGTKRPVELKGWSTDETEPRNMLTCIGNFLQCLPLLSQLRLELLSGDENKSVRKTVIDVILGLFISASDKGDDTLKILYSLCSYSSFPFADDTGEIQSIFLVELYFFVKEYETQTGRNVLPALLPIYQSAPSVWVLDLSKGVTSFLYQTMQLQATKKPVELRGWTNNEKDLKCFLHCLSFVSQLRFSDLGLILNDDISGAVKLVVHLFISASESGAETLNILSSVCSYSTFPFADDTGEVQSTFLLELYSYVREFESQTGRCVLPALKPIYQSAPATWVIHLSKGVTPLLCETMQVQAMKRPVEIRGLTTDESELRTILHCVPYMLELKCSGRFFQSVCEVLSTGQNWNPVEVATLLRPLNFTVTLMEMLPRRICSAVGRVLSQADPKEHLCLSLFPQSISWQGMNALFSAISRLQKLRTDSQFVRNALNEIYASHAGHLVTNLVRSSDNWINLSEQELESYDCAALRFALHYSDDVKLNLLGTVIPKEEAENILQLLHRVSELRVDRHLLLNLLDACSRSREQKKVTTSLLMALHNKLDFSQSSTANLFGQESRKTLSLSDVDCRSISTAIQLSACDTELIMFDCEASDGTLLELFPALRHIHLSLDKPELLRLMLLTQYVGEARALARSLGKEIDLSHTTLNSCACEVLGLVLEHSEHLSHLNLSHCKLTDSCLNLLLPHLHKVQELDLSNNDITDTGAQKLQKFLVRTQTVHIFNNHITDMSFFMNNQYNPVVSIEIDHNWPTEKGDHSKFLVTDDPVFMMKQTIGILTKKITTVTVFDPEISVHDDVIVYRFECEMGGEFQCRATELVFGMKDRGCVEYRVIHWDIGCFSNNNYEPAGPLYDIKTTIGEIYLLHLPHCEAEADALGDISVAHMHDGVTEILTPVQITSSHVTVRISGLSSFLVVRRRGCMTRFVRGQVLLFLDQINRVEQRLWVFLLARNVSATEIKKEHQEFTPIKTSSDCILRQKGKYCLSSSLKKYKVQPKTYVFHNTRDPDHHSAFELFFGSEVSELRVRIHEKRSPKRETTKWNRRVILKCNDNRAYKIKTEGGTNGKGNCLLTEKKWRSSLSDLLDELHEDELKKMKAYMRDYTDFAPIPKGKLEKKERHELVDLIVETWGFQTSVQAVAYIMRKLPRNDYAVTSILKPYQIQFGLITEQENTDF